MMTDFSLITACGECCTDKAKKADGRCPGCIESDGRVPEWLPPAGVRFMPASGITACSSAVYAMNSLAKSFLY